MYRLVITKIEPLTEEEIKKHEDMQRRSNNYGHNQIINNTLTKETRVVKVELTEKEYAIIRASLISYWNNV